jgi:diguanylate cyclase (GGDEF)-like protein/PAS domain S-box-containing protein
MSVTRKTFLPAVGILFFLSISTSWYYINSVDEESSESSPDFNFDNLNNNNSSKEIMATAVDRISTERDISDRTYSGKLGDRKNIATSKIILSIIFVIILFYPFFVFYLIKLIKTKSILQLRNQQLQLKITEDEKVINKNIQTLHFEKERVKMFSTVMEQSHDSVMVTNESGKIEYVNPKFTESTGYSNVEILGKNSRLVQPEWISNEVQDEFFKTLDNNKAWRSEVQYKRKNGEVYWAFESISSIKDEQGHVIHYLSTHRDITQEYKLNEQLNFNATHDELTKLINRREFERRVERLLSVAGVDSAEHALCYMDLDQFKVVNDTCGHVAGDELLRQLSSVLLNTIRKRDTLARLGGDEFGLLFEHCSLDDAHHITKSLLNAVQNFQFSWEGRSFKLGVSIGLIAITEKTLVMTELLKAADTACYMAKDAGRNRIHIYHADDSEIQERQGEIQWVPRINQALDNNLFRLYAQAIVPIEGNTELHYELLIRMIDDKGDIIPPGAFLPSAERYNLITHLDRWVIAHAFKLLLKHTDFLKQINFVSINISGPSLADPEFLDFVHNELKQTQLDPEKICFEITETAAISNLNRASLFISLMKKLGCRFALDDFGSGLSSFAYLKNLPVDYLKIDGMFVKDIVDDPIDYAMVKSINEIGHVMGMKTIAEFVENDEIKNMLKELDVDYVQGYGIGKPMPLTELFEE